MFLTAFDPSVKSTHAWDTLLLTGLLFLVAPLESCPVEGTCIWLLYENTDILQDTGRQPVLSSGLPAVAEMQPSQPRMNTAHTRRSHCALGKTRLAGCHSLLEAPARSQRLQRSMLLWAVPSICFSPSTMQHILNFTCSHQITGKFVVRKQFSICTRLSLPAAQNHTRPTYVRDFFRSRIILLSKLGGSCRDRGAILTKHFSEKKTVALF